jgi:Sugar phosphate isomerases/epimerases
MKLGAYTACLHDRSLAETLKILGELGLTGAEINSGGFLPPVHIPVDDLLASAGAREDYLGQFRDAGITLTGSTATATRSTRSRTSGRRTLPTCTDRSRSPAC